MVDTVAAEEDTLAVDTRTVVLDMTSTTDTTVVAGMITTGVVDVTTGTMITTVTIRITTTEGIGGDIQLIMRLGNDWADLADRRGIHLLFIGLHRDRYDRRERSPPRRREYYE